ncbi:hypothetical protein [Streptomyces sp. NPDC059893]|uniref:hypothetical protein n=1 Tax=Streptomyces sp. NPDC059893 TaxID=3346990 RepID=UPI003650E4BF
MFGDAIHLADHNKDGRADLSVGAGGENSRRRRRVGPARLHGRPHGHRRGELRRVVRGHREVGDDPMFGDAMSGS